MKHLHEKPIHLMSADEQMEFATEHAAMAALGQFMHTELLDTLDGADVVILRHRLDAAIRQCITDAIRDAHYIRQSA